MWDPNILTNFNSLFKPYKSKENTKVSVNSARYDDNSYLHGDITADHTVDDIEKRWAKEDKEVWTPKYDKPKNPITKENQVWEKDKIRAHVERFFLLKQNIMREILESYGEYVGEIDYNKPKITYKSTIKDDKEDWNKNFSLALINNCYAALNGEFIIPAPIVSFIKSVCIPSFKVTWNRTPLTASESKFIEAEARVRALVQYGMTEYCALAIAGCMWNEDSWAAKSSGICYDGGESMIGLTSLDMKLRVVKRLGLMGYPSMNPYNYGISKLPNDLQLKCCIDYFEHESGSTGRWLVHEGKDPSKVKDVNWQTVTCGSAYLSKAGQGTLVKQMQTEYILAGLKSRAGAYFNLNKYEGFSHGMFAAYMLAKYIKGKSEGKPLKTVLQQAKTEIEGVFGSIPNS